MNDGGDSVNEIDAYSDLLADVWTIYGGFTNPTYKITTQVLNEYDMLDGIDLPTNDDFGGGTLGILRQQGVTHSRVRGGLLRSGTGPTLQFEQFNLGMELIIHRTGDALPLVQAETATLIINRWGDIIIEGEDVISSIFQNENLPLDLTGRINFTDQIYELGVSINRPEVGLLHDFEIWNITVHEATGVLGVDLKPGGFEGGYLGLDLEGSINFMPVTSNGFGGQVLFGVIHSNSPVIQNHFGDLLDHLDIVPDAPGSTQSASESLKGAYIRMYGDGGLLSDLANGKLGFDGGIRYGGWYWSRADHGGGVRAGGLLGAYAYGRFLAVVKMRGDITFIYAYNAGDHSISSEAWVAGGLGFCEPETWSSWNSRWWNDRWCWTAGAFLGLEWNVTQGNFDVDVQIDTEVGILSTVAVVGHFSEVTGIKNPRPSLETGCALDACPARDGTYNIGEII
ncbi:hypothetical protein KFU94_10955 [Chloroflexi bacterium TSY]|nr:hypothetical protein [Chloroflexi bacterium TSY]